MNKCYLLLRNNKETGPYTVADLLQLSLTAKDLVWVEGKSAGWRYPFEFDELKEAVAGYSEPIQPATNTTESYAGEPLQVKRQSARKIFVSLPSVVKKQPLVTAPSLEEKAEALRQKALSFVKDKEVTEVTYTRSLTDIKEEYAGWIQEQKRERKRLTVSRPLVFTALFAVITSVSFFLLQWKPKQEKPTQALLIAAKEVAPEISKNTENIEPNKEVESTSEEVAQEPLKPEPIKSEPFKNEPTGKIFQNTVAVATPAKLSPLLEQEAKPTLPVTVTEVPLVKKKAADDIPIADLIQTTSHYTKNKDGIGLSIELLNKGDKNIRVVAVDVIHFNKAKVQIAKETLYFSNVQPGASLTKRSSPKKAASASYRIGLVSAENAGLYVMQ